MMATFSYGCDLAKSDAGQQLIATLARLSGADVSRRGMTQRATQNSGVTWDLEFRRGLVETKTSLGHVERNRLARNLNAGSDGDAEFTGGRIHQSGIRVQRHAGEHFSDALGRWICAIL